MKRLWPAGVIVLGLLFVAGCEQEETPAEQATESLEQARQSIEEMESRAEDLAETIQQRTQRIEEQRLGLIDARLASYRTEVTNLPAAQETQLRQSLAQLDEQRQRVSQRLEAYVAAPPEQSDRLQVQYNQAVQQLETAVDAFGERLAEAQAG